MDVNELIKKWHEKREVDAEKFNRCFPESDDLLAIVLRGHLFVEEYIDRLNRHYFHYVEYYDKANFNFYKKLLLAKAFLLLPHPNREMFFSPIENFNDLRNDLAHRLESHNLNNKIMRFLSAVEQRYSKELLEKFPLGDTSIEKRMRNAISYILGELDILDNVIEFMEKSRVYGGNKFNLGKDQQG